MTANNLCCPVCSRQNINRKLILHQINLDTAVYLCEDNRCDYPKNGVFLEVSRNFTDMIPLKKSSKKQCEAKNTLPNLDKCDQATNKPYTEVNFDDEEMNKLIFGQENVDVSSQENNDFSSFNFEELLQEYPNEIAPDILNPESNLDNSLKQNNYPLLDISAISNVEEKINDILDIESMPIIFDDSFADLRNDFDTVCNLNNILEINNESINDVNSDTSNISLKPQVSCIESFCDDKNHVESEVCNIVSLNLNQTKDNPKIKILEHIQMKPTQIKILENIKLKKCAK